MKDWSQFCVVGYGRHSQAHLLPAMENIGLKVHSIVTSKAHEEFASRVILFPDLDIALKSVPPGTCFLVATAPIAHFVQTRMILEHGFDVLIEKPAFVSNEDLKHVLTIVRKNQFFGVAYMYKHSYLFKHLKTHWLANRYRSRSIELRFLIPEIPHNTFRSDSSLENSIVFDIGCYIADTLVELDMDLSSINVTKVEKQDGIINYVSLSSSGSPNISAEFGFGFPYQNCFSLTYDDETISNFEPFYWGRAGLRTVKTVTRGGAKTSMSVDERNVFEIMLGKKRQYWIDHQELEIKKLSLTTKLLEQWSSSVRLLV